MEQTAKRIGICVLSGTGNTLRCAKALETVLAEQGVSVGFHEIADGSETAPERDLVICYPVYGFNMPRILKPFCRNLTGGGNVWFLKISGEPLHLNDNSSAELIRILRKNGSRMRQRRSQTGRKRRFPRRFPQRRSPRSAASSIGSIRITAGCSASIRRSASAVSSV